MRNLEMWKLLLMTVGDCVLGETETSLVATWK